MNIFFENQEKILYCVISISRSNETCLEQLNVVTYAHLTAQVKVIETVADYLRVVVVATMYLLRFNL